MLAWARLLDAHGELIGYGLVSRFALLWIASTRGLVAGRPCREINPR
jgi:hypothetical protein